MIQTWRLDDGQQTFVLASTEGRMPCVIYWGATLPSEEDLQALMALREIDVTGGMLDAHADLSLCPEAGRSFPGQPGIMLRDAQGKRLRPRFDLQEVEQAQNALTLTCSDKEIGLTYRADIALDQDTRMLVLRASIETERPVILEWLAAPVLPGPQQGSELWDFSGRWCGEFQLNRSPWSPGVRLRESTVGRTDHAHFPGLILPGSGVTNGEGEVWGFHYGWSGGHRMLAEELPDGRRQVQFGHALGTEEKPGQHFETAPLFACYSGAGLNGLAQGFQRHLRDSIIRWPRSDRPRPVHYNCWEAVYFDHDLKSLKEIARLAAELGAERFVLDDGWFGRRDDDTTSLGDWRVDARKYPDGLSPLIEEVQAIGMTFGLWLEPEMVSPDSDLFRANPQWALGPENQILGRQQRVLNMALPEVREYLLGQIATLLDSYAIDYIKWDHNRVLPFSDAEQTRGTYALLDRLGADFPHVEIESCASGGGRIDFGILTRTQRVWLSDSNDALERLRMQHNAALFLPAAVTGSHVGPRRCHTSGRTLDMGFRAWVAAQRHMGFEMDPRELTPEEADVLKEVTSWWKNNRDWLMRADILRLDTSDGAIIAEQQLAEDGSRFVVFAGRAEASSQISPRPLQLQGLEPDSRYRLHLRNREAATHLSRGEQALKRADLTVSGAALMQQGVALPWAFPETMWVLEGEQL